MAFFFSISPELRPSRTFFHFSYRILNFWNFRKTEIFQSIGICLYFQSFFIFETHGKNKFSAKTPKFQKKNSRGVPLYSIIKWEETNFFGLAFERERKPHQSIQKIRGNRENHRKTKQTHKKLDEHAIRFPSKLIKINQN